MLPIATTNKLFRLRMLGIIVGLVGEDMEGRGDMEVVAGVEVEGMGVAGRKLQ